MKEIKVYTGRRNGKHAELMQRLDKALKEQHFAFVFTKQELKEHDRELVKEVCEKIKRNVRVTRIKKKWFAFEDDLRNILDQIQKEYEK